MQLDRRHFLALATALMGSPVVSLANDGKAPLFLSAASDSDDRHWVMGFTLAGANSTPAFRHALPSRAHHIAVHEGLGIYIVIARRPGNWLWIGDLATGNPLGEIRVPENRHVYGHGVFAADGGSYYGTESDWQDMTGDSGLVVAWDVSRTGDHVSLVRRAEFPTAGVGPHELLLKTDQQTLIVANGGIRTRPDMERENLNIDTMVPSLVYLDANTGQLLEQHFLEEKYHQASIRHMDLNASGQVAIGMQYEGEPFDRVPLVATHMQGQPLNLLWAPDEIQGQMSQYVGSVRFDAGGRFFAASCPRGNMITFWDAANGELVHTVRSRDGCGVAAYGAGFLVTTGTGRISWYDLAADHITDFPADAIGRVFWDNHLTVQGS